MPKSLYSAVDYNSIPSHSQKYLLTSHGKPAYSGIWVSSVMAASRWPFRCTYHSSADGRPTRGEGCSSTDATIEEQPTRVISVQVAQHAVCSRSFTHIPLLSPATTLPHSVCRCLRTLIAVCTTQALARLLPPSHSPKHQKSRNVAARFQNWNVSRMLTCLQVPAARSSVHRSGSAISHFPRLMSDVCLEKMCACIRACITN